MASRTGDNDPGGSGQGILSEPQSRDLPSKRLLGKGLASIGYETEWEGVRYARKDFVGVPRNIFRNEATVLVRLKNHQNVVETHGLTSDKLSCSLVLEYMDDKLSGLLQKRKECKRSLAGTVSGNLSELNNVLPFEFPEALYLILQIARGMNFLHEQDIGHGDLKTRNILVTYTNNSDKNLLSVKSVKVADFGIVQTKRKSMSYVSRQVLMLDRVRWKAPEYLEMLLLEATSSESDSKLDNEYIMSSGATLSADVYSFAVTCFQILTGEEPYPKQNWKELVIDIVSNKLRPRLPVSLPQVLSDLLVSCWSEDPTQRPTFSYICKKLERIHAVICYQLQGTIKELSEQMEKDYSSLKSIESVEPIFQVSEALKIVEDVTSTSSKILMNKHQCERLASRLHAIGEKLKDLPKEFLGSQSSDPRNKMDHPAFDVLLTVLREGKALLSKYIESKGSIPSVLSWTENQETFKEINTELDLLNSLFNFEDFESTSEIERSAMLTSDADEDLKEMFESLHELAHTDMSRQAAFLAVLSTNLERVKLMVTEKSESINTSNDLPRNMNIDLVNMEIKDEVRVPESMSGSSDTEYVTAPDPEISNSLSRRLAALQANTSTDKGRAHSGEMSATIRRRRTRIARTQLGRRESRVCGGSTRGNTITDKGFTHTRKYRSLPNMTRRSSTLSEGERFWSCRSMELVESGKFTYIEDLIERSKGHWDPDEDTMADNVEVFKTLQRHPKWGSFFQTFGEGELVVGEKFAEGAQAELFQAHLKWADPKMNEADLKYGRDWALKVFRKDYSLGDWQTLWRQGLMQLQDNEEQVESRNVINIVCGTLLEDGRFAFLMEREQHDLQSVIDHKMLTTTSHDGGPFSKGEAVKIMHQIALGMGWLHARNIIHRDLKASNVLINNKDKMFDVYVADFECSIGVVGTGFFRAPEILQACKERNVSRRPEIFSKAADVYSYGMTCYEILTGKRPFEGHVADDYDIVLKGQRPKVPKYVDDWTLELLKRCWQPNPADRPSFEEISNLLLGYSGSAIRDNRLLEQQSEIAYVKDNVYESQYQVEPLSSTSLEGEQREVQSSSSEKGSTPEADIEEK